MKLTAFQPNQAQDVIQLITDVFTDSEGADEGNLIGQLAKDLIETETDDVVCFRALENDKVIASIFFSRLVLSNHQIAFILAPVAVAIDRQKQGIGQRLIRFGIEQLKSKGIELLFTYGDPNYYSKSGFVPITEDEVKAPLKLSYPHGWLIQSLSDDDINLKGIATHCIPALNDQRYW